MSAKPAEENGARILASEKAQREPAEHAAHAPCGEHQPEVGLAATEGVGHEDELDGDDEREADGRRAVDHQQRRESCRLGERGHRRANRHPRRFRWGGETSACEQHAGGGEGCSVDREAAAEPRVATAMPANAGPSDIEAAKTMLSMRLASARRPLGSPARRLPPS